MGVKGDMGIMGPPGAQGSKGGSGEPGPPGKRLHGQVHWLIAIPPASRPHHLFFS